MHERIIVTSIFAPASHTFQTIEKFRHRDDRGEGIRHNGFHSKTPEEASAQLWRHSPGWPDKNGDQRYDVTYELRTPPADADKKPFNKTGFTAVGENQRLQTRLSLQSIEDVANVKFIEGPKTETSEGHLIIGNYGQRFDSEGKPKPSHPHADLPSSRLTHGSAVWFVDRAGHRTVPDAALGNSGRYTLVHELGHAMGLSHAGYYNGNLDISKVSHHEDSRSHTVMSYRGERTGHIHHQGFWPSAPQLDDIRALQDKYGVRHDTRNDDTTYGFNSTTERDFLSVTSAADKIVAAIWDGGGIDTLDFSGYRHDQQLSLKAGTLSDVGGLKGNVSIAYGALIENAIGGSGNDVLVGNELANTLKGGDGDDWLYGAEGADTLWSGHGKDQFVYGKISESTQAASDLIMDFVSGEDRVDVSGIRAALGRGPLKFVSAFSGASAEAILSYDPVLHMSTLQITGNHDEPTFVLRVNGRLQRSDIVG